MICCFHIRTRARIPVCNKYSRIPRQLPLSPFEKIVKNDQLMKIFHECEQTGVRMLRVCGHHVARTNRLAFQQLIDVLKIRDYNRNRCREFFQLFFFLFHVPICVTKFEIRNRMANRYVNFFSTENSIYAIIRKISTLQLKQTSKLAKFITSTRHRRQRTT